nr:tyrosine-type recombinase/integrase [bacterium]
MSARSHAQQLARQRRLELRDLLKELPPCCEPYFRAIADRTQELTRLGYACDLRGFFTYLTQEIPAFRGMAFQDIMPQTLSRLTAEDIERYLEYITYYEHQDRELENHAEGKSRKIAAIRTLLQFWFERGVLEGNVGALVKLPKRREKNIIRLEPDEVANLLDFVEKGDGLTAREKAWHQKTRTRDLAILTTFLGTGIRISELVGLNRVDIDFDVNGLRITRKGGKQAIVYFWVEVQQALKAYLAERANIQALPGHEDALFLSMQRRRITPRAVENLVEKYARHVAPLKPISPHKLRSTYGTTLYRETGDIYLVADVLGHRDVNTTRRHYAALEDERRRAAASAVRLRDSAPEDDSPDEF